MRLFCMLKPRTFVICEASNVRQFTVQLLPESPSTGGQQQTGYAGCTRPALQLQMSPVKVEHCSSMIGPSPRTVSTIVASTGLCLVNSASAQEISVTVRADMRNTRLVTVRTTRLRVSLKLKGVETKSWTADSTSNYVASATSARMLTGKWWGPEGSVRVRPSRRTSIIDVQGAMTLLLHWHICV
ncbi:hypothetical protein M011DRAFT_464724 [Sporormia fimetaria CBS 119925]|uniref:Uncharacterized protein n=1 Tax=Sporormia fimetaria CBS 119925 TaxID=1340428 RepID=A0A6A6VMG3_9PLEO|nr:hypothetical protein M011DRAFT_464724 [Sporormia fimetaria CBS 119925]